MQAFGYLRRDRMLDTPHNAAWLEAQRLAIRRFCRKRRIELVQFFESEGEEYVEDSALDQMFSALEEREADCAVVCGEYEGPLSYNIDHLEKTVEIRFYSKTLHNTFFEEAV